MWLADAGNGSSPAGKAGAIVCVDFVPTSIAEKQLCGLAAAMAWASRSDSSIPWSIRHRPRSLGVDRSGAGPQKADFVSFSRPFL